MTDENDKPKTIRCEDGTVVTLRDYRQISVGEFEEAVREGRVLPVGRPINEVIEELVAPPTCEEALRELVAAITDPDAFPVEVEDTPFGETHKLVENPRIAAALRAARRALGG